MLAVCTGGMAPLNDASEQGKLTLQMLFRIAGGFLRSQVLNLSKRYTVQKVRRRVSCFQNGRLFGGSR
jgi:hypothetical protein